ncbi:MAG: hypothetical protein ACRDQ0_08065 [Pseudonocardia sp.]
MEDGDYLLASVVDDEDTGNPGAMLDVSQFTVAGRRLFSVDRLLHFDEFDGVLGEMGYRRTEPWGTRSGIRSARVERQ